MRIAKSISNIITKLYYWSSLCSSLLQPTSVAYTHMHVKGSVATVIMPTVVTMYNPIQRIQFARIPLLSPHNSCSAFIVIHSSKAIIATNFELCAWHNTVMYVTLAMCVCVCVSVLTDNSVCMMFYSLAVDHHICYFTHVCVCVLVI